LDISMHMHVLHANWNQHWYFIEFYTSSKFLTNIWMHGIIQSGII
jgi:hypothetical protein